MNVIYIKWLVAIPAIVLTAGGAWAQDLTAGKTPAQLFSSDCAACHHAPNGLGRKETCIAAAHGNDVVINGRRFQTRGVGQRPRHSRLNSFSMGHTAPMTVKMNSAGTDAHTAVDR